MASSSDGQLKALIVAPHASARFGGESILPLHYFKRLPQFGVEPYLVVHERTRKELQEELTNAPGKIYYVPDTKLHKRLHKLQSMLPKRLGFFSFGMLLGIATQITQKKLVKQVIAKENIDLVHEPIRVSPKYPSLMYGLGVPVVHGPMNGGMTYPRGFESKNRFEALYVRVGRLLSDAVHMIAPGKRQSTTLLVANERTRKALPKTNCKNIKIIPENGVDLSVFSDQVSAEGNKNDVVKLAFVGRLVDWKRVDILLRAIKKAESQPIELHILGDGDQKQKLQKMQKELGLEDKVFFHGFLPQQECADFLTTCDCLVLPSVYECGGAVVLEAMAVGKPVIASNWGGPADYINESCGILVDVTNGPERFVDDLAAAIKTMASDDEKRREMGRNGRRRVEEYFDWTKKTEQIVGVYNESIELYNAQKATTKMGAKRAKAVEA